MQTQIITEAGTVIGIFDPKDEHSHLTGDSEITKADRPGTAQAAWDKTIKAKLEDYNAKVKEATTAPAAKRTLKKIAADAVPKSTAGKAAMVGVPAAAALAASSTVRGKAKEKYAASRDVRHYRPASAYYDDGFGKALPSWFKAPKGAAKLRDDIGSRAKTVPKAAYARAAGTATDPGPARKAARTLDNPAVQTAALSAAATGATAAAGAVKAARASRKAAKLKVVKDAHRRQNIKDAALVGSVAAPVGLAVHLASQRKVEKGMLSAAGKKLKATGQKIADPAWQKKVSDQAADLSGNTARTATNIRSTVNDVKETLIPKSKRKPPTLSMGQKAAIGGAGVGGLLIGRELSGPKPYPYQQQK